MSDPDREPIGYLDAMAELDGILAELEDEHLDIDRLAERVARAADLIRTCRDRIGAARVEVERIVAELDDLTAE